MWAKVTRRAQWMSQGKIFLTHSGDFSNLDPPHPRPSPHPYQGIITPLIYSIVHLLFVVVLVISPQSISLFPCPLLAFSSHSDGEPGASIIVLVYSLSSLIIVLLSPLWLPSIILPRHLTFDTEATLTANIKLLIVKVIWLSSGLQRRCR